MSFRRSNSEEPGSSRWRRQYQSDLLACGVPTQALDSDRQLNYVLLHGRHPDTGWDISWLSDDQAERLLSLLKEAVSNPLGYDLIADLERRLESRR